MLAEGQGFRLYQVLYQPGTPYVIEEGHYMQLIFAKDQPGAVGITSDISFPQVLSINHFWLLAVDGREDTLPEWACEPSWQFGDTQYIALRRAQARDISFISQYLNKANSPLIGFSGDTH